MYVLCLGNFGADLTELLNIQRNTLDLLRVNGPHVHCAVTTPCRK